MENSKLTQDSITVSLQVKNSTDQEFRFNLTYGIDESDVWVNVPIGETITLQSNTHEASGTIFTGYIIPPLDLESPYPASGNFQMSYGYWDNAAHVTCDNNCNEGYPTSKVHYEGNNWIYNAEFKEAESVVNNFVEFTTSIL